MAIYRFRVWLLPNPLMEFEPETEVWRDIEIDGSHALTDFHEGIFEAFDRRDMHAYEFLTRDEHGIATRSYAHPQMYCGDQSWEPMEDEEIDRSFKRTIPDDAPEEARERLRELRKNPPEEDNAAETTIDDLNLEGSQTLFYEFDFGDSWEHHIELKETRDRIVDVDPRSSTSKARYHLSIPGERTTDR